eukprot:NODE_265_length_12372_cov_0.450012.p1 type:complete len:598 gc:universal NODE_265_length_12372_cov_0.450012:9407-11200(+)
MYSVPFSYLFRIDLPLVKRKNIKYLSYLKNHKLYKNAYKSAINDIFKTIELQLLEMFQLPNIDNEPIPNYEPGSAERQKLQSALEDLVKEFPVQVPIVVNGKPIFNENQDVQYNPSNHHQKVCSFSLATKQQVQSAIDGALKARESWDLLDFQHKAAIFLKAADLLSGKYRYRVMAATMLGQGKNVWQAAIDSHAELVDFWRFNVQYAYEIMATQPKKHSPHVWNRLEYRGLEGFVYSISPFNFTAIGGNLPSAPSIMGNVNIWKPSPSAVLSNYIVYQILEDAGIPPGVIQFIPGDAVMVTDICLKSPDFAGLHFTGSTAVFKSLWSKIGDNLSLYKNYPRIVGETGGKNMHFIHPSADLDNASNQIIRGGFEYQGQKCSALSRVYCPFTLFDKLKESLLHKCSLIKVGSVVELDAFMTPVINKTAFNKIKRFIEEAKNDSECELLFGGRCDDSIGYFIDPTIIKVSSTRNKLFKQEVFGPVVAIYVYKDEECMNVLKEAAHDSDYALTGSIFAQDRDAIETALKVLRHAAGNFYINDKCTGAVVGQQAFGGGRMSGTNDKAGAGMNLLRWTSARSIKESLVGLQGDDAFLYPSNK